jgi:hypothetical protein
MAGKSYIKGSSKWSQIKRMYVKTGPVWTSVRKAYIKTGNVWKKMFDSSSRVPYTTETPTIRHDSYTGTIVSSLSLSTLDPTGESRVGIKLWGRENPSSWGNAPFTSQTYQWYAADNKEGTNAYIIKDTSDTYYVGSSENNADYDGLYLFFRALYTNAYGTGTANSLPVYVHKLAPSKMTGASGVVSGISSTATQVGTPIQFDYAWHNEYYKSIDQFESKIEWYRGYPLSDKSNLLQSRAIWYTNKVTENDTELSGDDTYTPVLGDVGSTIYVVMTGNNTYTLPPLQSAIFSSPNVSTFYTSTTVSTKPVINNPVTISKLDGYQTVGFRLSANTQTYTPSATTVYWGWQWASSPTAPDTSWRALQSRYLSPVIYSYITTNYFGSESNQGIDHTLYIPSTAYDGSADVSLVGKYLRFYSIGVASGATSDTNNSTSVIGPIYDVPTSAGAPSIYFNSPYSSSYAYIRAFWNPATYSLDYTLQYQSGSTWVDVLTVTDAPQYVSTGGILVPTGNLTFRVKTRNGDGLEAYSSTVQFDVPSGYSFAFGNYLYPNTNGQIGLDNGTTSTTPSGGRLLAIYPKDLAETTTGYYSDDRYYYIQFSGYQYNQVGVAAYALRYQVKFDSQNPSYADVLICNKGSSLTLSTSAGLYNGSTQISGLPGPYVLQTNTTFRIYMDGSGGSFGQIQAQIPSANFITHPLDFGGTDDGYHSILTAKNQYQTDMLNVTTTTVNSSGISIAFNGVNNYSYYNYTVNTGGYYGTLFASGNNQTANPLNVGSLTGGTRYYVTITPYNSLNQPGTSYQNFFDAPSAPSAFTTISGSKGFPSGAVQNTSQPTGNRTLSVSWNASTNGPNYEVQYEGSNDNSTWTILQSLAGSTYKTVTSDTYVAAYYKYYRFSVRARGADYSLTNAAYSDGGTSTSLVYRTLTGTDPSNVTLGTVTKTSTTASIPFTIPAGGSNTIDWIQYSTDAVSWSNTYTSPLSLSSLTASTSYTYYFRALNYDGLTSGTTSASFTTDATPAVIPTITMGSNTGVTQTAGTINWTSTNQSSYSSDGTFSGTGTTGTSISKTGLTAGTTYTGTVTVTSSTGNTAQANYSLTTSSLTSYTITYDGNGATSGSTTATTGNGSVTLRSNGFTRTNCSFSSWNTNAAGTGTNYNAGASYTLSADVTLYAKWTANSNSATAPTVTWVGNFGSGTTSYKRWTLSGGTVTGGTATGYQYAISSISGTSGFGAWSATTTATTIDITVANASTNPRWLVARRVYTDGLGVTKTGTASSPGV